MPDSPKPSLDSDKSAYGVSDSAMGGGDFLETLFGGVQRKVAVEKLGKGCLGCGKGSMLSDGLDGELVGHIG